MPVFDLQIHPRDHELIAATHGRSLWIVDIAALEQMTPQRRCRRARICSRRRRRISGAKVRSTNLPGNGYGQALMTYANPPYGADIVYRLALGGVRRRAARREQCGGRHARESHRSGRGGRASRDCGTSSRRRRARRRRSCRRRSSRDSILLRVRAPAVLDSLTQAGFDTAAIRTVRAQVAQMTNPNPNAGGGRGGRGGGGGRWTRRRGGQACEHPTTQWETFCARPAENAAGVAAVAAAVAFGADSAAAPAAAAPAARLVVAVVGGRGGAAARRATRRLNPVERIWSLIGMNPPAPAGGRGGGGGGGSAVAPATTTANTGDYLVTMIVNGQSYRQTFRVERVSGGGDSANPFGGDEEHDALGRYTPKTPKAK